MKTDVVILTTGATGTPHLATIQAANPGVVIHVHEAADPVGEAAWREGWRNCDRNIREWWLAEGGETDAEAVLFLEWDVWADVSILTGLEGLGGKVGMLAPSMLTPLRGGRGFQPFQEMPRLPSEVRHLACAVVPLAVVALTRAALDALTDERWDALYEADVFSEMRLPTVVRACGFEVVRNAAWRQVTTTPGSPTGSGIFHPVKGEV